MTDQLEMSSLCHLGAGMIQVHTIAHWPLDCSLPELNCYIFNEVSCWFKFFWGSLS